MMKREILNVHVYVSLLSSEVLCRNFCWELVDRLSVWFSLQYHISSTTQLKNTHHLVRRKMCLWIYWQPLYSPKWLQQRSLEALRLQPLGRTSAVFLHGIRFMQTIPRTRSAYNTLGIVHKVKRQHTTATLGKLRTEYYHLVLCTLQEQSSLCLWPCPFSMWQLWYLMLIVRIKVCNLGHEEPKGKWLVRCS